MVNRQNQRIKKKARVERLLAKVPEKLTLKASPVAGLANHPTSYFPLRFDAFTKKHSKTLHFLTQTSEKIIYIPKFLRKMMRSDRTVVRWKNKKKKLFLIMKGSE